MTYPNNVHNLIIIQIKLYNNDYVKMQGETRPYKSVSVKQSNIKISLKRSSCIQCTSIHPLLTNTTEGTTAMLVTHACTTVF